MSAHERKRVRDELAGLCPRCRGPVDADLRCPKCGSAWQQATADEAERKPANA